jgi:hypothetical protein
MSDQLDFSKLWEGGYYEGNPAEPMGRSGYHQYGYISSLFAIYSACIRPYVRHGVTALEIGPGRGAWSKAIADCGPSRLIAVDAATAEHTHFWDYVGPRSNVDYFTVADTELAPVADDSVDYFFSFGVFCHLPPETSVGYIKSLVRKMKRGANGFLMVADFDKFNACHAKPYESSIFTFFADRGRRWNLLRAIIERLVPPSYLSTPRMEKPISGGWYHLGVPAAVQALEEAGFEIVEADMRLNSRDPLIHFRKPL